MKEHGTCHVGPFTKQWQLLKIVFNKYWLMDKTDNTDPLEAESYFEESFNDKNPSISKQ